MNVIDETKAAVATYLAIPTPTLAQLVFAIDSVDEAHVAILEAMEEAIHSAQVEADKCNEREKAHQDALSSVQELVDMEVRRTEEAYQARKELDDTAPRTPFKITKALQGPQPSNKRKRAKEHLAQGGVHDVVPESADIGTGA
ncbi:hypothetical protein ARMGADRAFT_77784 [Armillaria gallica]|uniref:Uncharacterized protein n=1 Tax=Armillaria gallica TaxID=47427 RepID=A0A2H3CMJ2_ARMGA|nr:hypothetical protein ARMGADRAFT_77784 [Armillaria gallica]